MGNTNKPTQSSQINDDKMLQTCGTDIVESDIDWTCTKKQQNDAKKYMFEQVIQFSKKYSRRRVSYDSFFKLVAIGKKYNIPLFNLLLDSIDLMNINKVLNKKEVYYNTYPFKNSCLKNTKLKQLILSAINQYQLFVLNRCRMINSNPIYDPIKDDINICIKYALLMTNIINKILMMKIKYYPLQIDVMICFNSSQTIIKELLSNNNIPFIQQNIYLNDLNDNKLKNLIITQLNNKTHQRICILIDRTNLTNDEYDELYIYQLPNKCELPYNYCDDTMSWYTENAIIPNCDDNYDLARNGMLTLSFHVHSTNNISYKQYIKGQRMIFLPYHMIELWPRYFYNKINIKYHSSFIYENWKLCSNDFELRKWVKIVDDKFYKDFKAKHINFIDKKYNVLIHGYIRRMENEFNLFLNITLINNIILTYFGPCFCQNCTVVVTI